MLLYREKYNPNRKQRSFNFTAKRQLLNLTIVLCLFLSSCTAIKEATSRAHTQKTKENKETTEGNVLTTDQFSPIKGKVISPFGYRGKHRHTGADIKLQKGDTVRAAYCGVVIKSCPYSGYGNLVILKHPNNMSTFYAHLSKCLVQVGDSVLAGQVVGLGGRTGRATTDHLHFEVRQNNVPRNPENFFDFSNGSIKVHFMAFTPGSKTRNELPRTINIRTQESAQNINNEYSESTVVIKKGDTLYALAKNFGTTVKQLQELNNLGNSNLKIGMKIKIK